LVVKSIHAVLGFWIHNVLVIKHVREVLLVLFQSLPSLLLRLNVLCFQMLLLLFEDLLLLFVDLILLFNNLFVLGFVVGSVFGASEHGFYEHFLFFAGLHSNELVNWVCRQSLAMLARNNKVGVRVVTD